ncbi:hypothetical protein ACIQUS_20510 [Pseudomonas sp. NPDC090755]|uniref:hypothetical protein n=1 Tax=Pseudomonas sp. NPDC090755 TaxID=3364481 RepID=UPI00383A2002
MKYNPALTIPLLALTIPHLSFAEERFGCDAICDTGIHVYCHIKVETALEQNLLAQIEKQGGFKLHAKVVFAGTNPSPEMCDKTIFTSEYVRSKSVPVIGPVWGEILSVGNSWNLGDVLIIGLKYAPMSPLPRILYPNIKTKL